MLRRASMVVVTAVIVLAAVWLFRPSKTEAPVIPDTIDAPSPATNASPQESSAVLPVPDPAFEQATSEYVAARSTLQSAFDEQSGEIEPEVIEPVKENLGLIERAVMELTIALAENPENDSLKERLLDMYGEQVGLLRKALNLAAVED